MRKPSFFSLCLTLVLFGQLLGAHQSQALTTFNYTGGNLGNWSAAGNWTPSGGPPNDAADAGYISGNRSVYFDTSYHIGGLTLDAGNTLNIKSGIILSMEGASTTVTNNGTIQLSASGNAQLMAYNGATTLSGSGTLQLGSYANNELSRYGTGYFINQVDHKIQGGGTISAPVTNYGLIQATAATMKITGNITNQGASAQLVASSGHILELSSMTVDGGKLDPGGGTVNFTGTSGATLTNGVELKAGTINVQSSSVFGGSLTSAATIYITNGNYLDLSGSLTLTNNGTINLNSTGTATHLRAYDGAVTLAGTGSVVLGSLPANVLDGYGSGYFINQVNHTIRGGGTISAPLTNYGTLQADNGTLKVTGLLTNYGTVRANAASTFDNATSANVFLPTAVMAGGTLESTTNKTYYATSLSGWGHVNASLVNNGGTVTAEGGTLNINETFTNNGAIRANTGGTFNNATHADLYLHSTIMAGGTLASTSGNRYYTDSGQNFSGYGTINARFTNVGSMTASGGTLNLANSNFTNNGTLTVASGAGFNNASGANVSLGNVVMTGGTLTTTSGSFINNNQIKGYGSVSASLTNNANVYADGGTNPLSLSGSVINTNHTLWGASSLSAGILELASGGTITGGFINPNNSGNLGTVRLAGATLNSVGLGSGTVNVQSSSTINGGTTASGTQLNINSGTLTIGGAVSGSGNVSVLNAATLSLNQSLGAGNFFMSDAAFLTVASSQNLTLSGSFSFAQQQEQNWSYGGTLGLGPILRMSGSSQTLEVGGDDLGAVAGGFSNNFGLKNLALTTGTEVSVSLLDAVNNANRVHQPQEALYVESLSVPSGTTLYLNFYNLYTYYGNQPYLVMDGDGFKFGGGQILNAPPVPLPGSLWLLGSALLALMGLGGRLKRS